MATLFKLPMLGQTMQEGTILKWYKAEGDPLEGWETLFEVMTDKVNMEVDPQVAGILRKILAPEGATVPVGAAVAIIGTADEPIDHLLAEAGGAPVLSEPPTNGGPTAEPSPAEVIKSSGHPVISRKGSQDGTTLSVGVRAGDPEGSRGHGIISP